MALTTMSQTWHWISPAVGNSDLGRSCMQCIGAYMCTLGEPGNCSMHLDGFGWVSSAYVSSGDICNLGLN